MEKVKITIETVLERHEVEVPANHYRKIKLRLFDMLMDDSNGEPLMDLEKEYRKENGTPFIETDCGDYYSAHYVDWLEERINKHEQNLRIMDNPDQEQGERPERPDDDGEE